MAYLEITRADGETTFHQFSGETIVGRSPDATITLTGQETLADEHFMVIPQGREGCWVAVANDVNDRVYVKGTPFQNGVLPWKTTFEVGDLHFTVHDKHPTEKKAAVSPVIWIAGLFVAAIFGVAYFMGEEETLTQDTSVKPPKLFAKDNSNKCGDSEPEKRGQKAEWEANVRGDRYPYDASEGIAAVHLYEQSIACWKSAGQTTEANDVKKTLNELKMQIESDYVTERLRLHRAIGEKDYDKAIEVSRKLLQLTSNSEDTHPYRSWLIRVERIVAARKREQAEKK